MFRSVRSYLIAGHGVSSTKFSPESVPLKNKCSRGSGRDREADVTHNNPTVKCQESRASLGHNPKIPEQQRKQGYRIVNLTLLFEGRAS